LDWNDELPEEEYIKAQEMCSDSDLVLCLGTSLRVEPANELPLLNKKKKKNAGKMVICNLQSTPKDEYADIKVHMKCDDLMRLIMKGLEMKGKIIKVIKFRNIM
jgi:NAD-dependent SIR2 family protein deacetylase